MLECKLQSMVASATLPQYSCTTKDASMKHLGRKVLPAVCFHATWNQQRWPSSGRAQEIVCLVCFAQWASTDIPSSVIECGFAGSRFCTACTGYHCLLQSSTSGVTLGIVSGGVVFVAPSCSKKQPTSLGKYIGDCRMQGRRTSVI